MANIEIQNPCSCVKKRKSWTNDLSFDTIEEAQKIALEMCEQGNTKFCKRHCFEVVNGSDTIIIDVKKREK